MLMLLPFDGDDTQEGRLVPIEEVGKWAVVEIEDGQIVETLFYDSRDEIEGWIDAVVVVDSSEYVWPFIEEQIMVLVAPAQRSLDDIFEAYLFKELHELSY